MQSLPHSCVRKLENDPRWQALSAYGIEAQISPLSLSHSVTQIHIQQAPAQT